MGDLPFERGKTRGLSELARLSSLLIVLEVRVGSARAPSVLCGRSIQTPDKEKVSERETATSWQKWNLRGVNGAICDRLRLNSQDFDVSATENSLIRHFRNCSFLSVSIFMLIIAKNEA
jgi:hypothetical protein